MRNGTPGFQASRLVEARESRGLTQVALGDLSDRRSSSVSRWESGEHSPEPEVLDILGRAMNLPVAFFMRAPPDHGDAPMFFRSMASTTQMLRRRVRARLRWAQDISLSLQNWVDLPPVDVPHLDAVDYRDIGDAEIENIATACRQRWGLGAGPISDVLLVMENAGICVIKEEVGSVTMDGLSNWSAVDQRPYVLIALDKDTCTRSRLDAAHELGHLVLHRNIREKDLSDAAAFKEIERQAYLFAGAFLLPAESFASEVWSPSLNALQALKGRWKVSIGAMLKRCETLEMVSEEYARRLWKHYSVRGWRKREPLDDVLVAETPRLLSRSVRLLIDERVCSRDDLLTEFRFAAADVESLCGLPRGYLTSEEAEVVTLPKIRERAAGESAATGASGTVVQFGRRA
jgi:Zn-dependent peptidase ImmA (M78 family)/transcriptional regulator with XRE-family HTH domain